ncbi:type VI secretion system ATPase TssH [Singulisphaera acidiphila]|uniref:Type VI secretion ATPase, ClpV1 family n=1 Tax=Singulisphaera acidiphila (strain ATCC BAA-1392 / DSM 18658 / VKM B-2454 / MOB10) TaxID=886293 RepID=L0DDI1_SINAD|nr:type VI secretion system ATPase TssH [Singulisphaera acidiphila]AGA26731.1 type VI secretion ATPase, ClpV1 family [Singulisphaera acidiphila DSM 18658]
MGVDSGAVIKTLNKTCVNSLQAAAGLCLSRTNYSVEVEHWLLKLTEVHDSDLARVFRHFEVNTSHLQRDLTKALDRLKTGNARTPMLSPSIDELIRSAWVLASLQYQSRQVRSGFLLLALLEDEQLGRLARDASPEFAKIKVETLASGMTSLIAGSAEEESPAREAEGQATPSRGAATQTPALDQYTINLTERARAGQIDPVLGRDAEVRQMVDILIRRRQNNPILTGEAGVGKTAVVEGLAARIAAGDVPEPLRKVVLRTLDLGLLQAGAGVKGEFENRLKQVIAEVKASPVPIVLFIDEAHTMIGAGGQAGQGDAANLLKPALARGELRTIAATTWAEYKKYFEKDAALARRFQVIRVEEPSEEKAIVMMRGITAMLESHHGVRILDEAVEGSVKLSARYIPGRQLPDKSVSLLDTACARVAISQTAIPPAVEDCRRRIDHLKVEIGILERENVTGVQHDARLAETREALAKSESLLVELEKRWKEERTLVQTIRGLAEQIEKAHAAKNGKAGELPTIETPAQPDKLKTELATRTLELSALQGDSPLMHVNVDSQTIAAVIAGWTGIPVGKMLADEIRTVLNLKTKLEERVIGQAQALEAVSQRIRTARANLTDPRRPIGVFLLVGPSGVGKTETAISLADSLYGGERNLVVINMSEYQEAHTVSGLKGSPPGYVGYGEGGVLTEAVRRKPYCVVLLDEVEKAHPDVMELFFQVFDKGTLEDGEGRVIDFKNTVILLTSNVGTETTMALCADEDTTPEAAGLVEALRPELLKVFPPALLGRLVVVPYYPISDEVMKQIVRLQLDRIVRRVRENHKAAFTYSEEIVANIASRCKEVHSGARNVDQILTRSLLPELSQEFLARMAEGDVLTSVYVDVDEQGNFRYQFS